MDARIELKRVAQEIRLSLSTYVIPLGAWADRIEAIAAALDEKAEPVSRAIQIEYADDGIKRYDHPKRCPACNSPDRPVTACGRAAFFGHNS